MNKDLLRSIMVLHRDTNKTLAEYLGISEKSVNDKINEKGTEFKQSEIAAIVKRYCLSDEQVRNIFFNQKCLIGHNLERRDGMKGQDNYTLVARFESENAITAVYRPVLEPAEYKRRFNRLYAAAEAILKEKHFPKKEVGVHNV